MNMFSYYITTHFISSNKDYNSYRNPHSVYQMYSYNTSLHAFATPKKGYHIQSQGELYMGVTTDLT